MDAEELLSLFVKEKPKQYTTRNTSHGKDDFREVILAEWEPGILPERYHDRLVVKIADNSFTDPKRISMWKRCAEEYLQLGYYCPRILTTEAGGFPYVDYKGRRCVIYGEEYSKYQSAESIGSQNVSRNGYYTYIDDAILMNARVAAQYFDYTDYPSGYCLFEKFCPADPEDEVLENALEWKRTADSLPAGLEARVERIWQRWNRNREQLADIYPRLPRSVFQADINYSNCLLDDDGTFKGVYDFNLAGRDVFLNYLFREIPYVTTTNSHKTSDEEDFVVRSLLHAIEISKQAYHFSEAERNAAILLYRCLEPLWYTEVEQLKRAGENLDAINKCLDETEYMQTREIDFAGAMV